MLVCSAALAASECAAQSPPGPVPPTAAFVESIPLGEPAATVVYRSATASMAVSYRKGTFVPAAAGPLSSFGTRAGFDISIVTTANGVKRDSRPPINVRYALMWGERPGVDLVLRRFAWNVGDAATAYRDVPCECRGPSGNFGVVLDGGRGASVRVRVMRAEGDAVRIVPPPGDD